MSLECVGESVECESLGDGVTASLHESSSYFSQLTGTVLTILRLPSSLGCKLTSPPLSTQCSGAHTLPPTHAHCFTHTHTHMHTYAHTHSHTHTHTHTRTGDKLTVGSKGKDSPSSSCSLCQVNQALISKSVHVLDEAATVCVLSCVLLSQAPLTPEADSSVYSHVSSPGQAQKETWRSLCYGNTE